MVHLIKSCKPHCIVITGDFNCRTKQWWPGDVEIQKRSAPDEFIESTNLSQLIDEPTNIRTTAMSCIDLTITDQPNLFVDFGVHSSLYDQCQHQIINGKLNISVPPPPPYKRKIWHYVKAQKEKFNRLWETLIGPLYCGLDIDEMIQLFASKCIYIFSQYIPNEIVTCDDRHPPWMTATLKSAIKHKHRVYNKYVKRGRKPNDWEYVRKLHKETSSKITKAKDAYVSETSVKNYRIQRMESNHIGPL